MYCALTDHFVPNLGCKDGEPINKPKTNADRIRSMTDEELAEFMQDVAMQGGIPLGGVPIRWIDWLKSPVEVSE